MRRFYAVELYKLSRRKDVLWSLIIGVLVPLLMAFLAYRGNKSLQMGGSFSAFEYSITMFGFLKMLFFFYIVFIVFTSSIVSGEIEEGSLSFLIIRSERREKIILAKFFALLTLLIVFVVLVFLSGIGSYYAFFNSTKYATHEFLGEPYLPFLYALILSTFELAFVIAFTMLISLFFNRYVTLLLSMGSIILMKVFENIEKIKRFIPTYISDVDKWGITITANKELSTKALQSAIFLSIYIIIILIITLHYFLSMDIKG